MLRSWLPAVTFGLLLPIAVLGDHAASTWAEGLPPSIRGVALVLTALGNSGYMFAGSALVAVVAWLGCRSTQDRQVCADLSRLMDRALLFFVTIAATGVAAQALKHLVGRARPKVDGLSAFAFHPLSLSNAFASFPSGHATSTFAAATTLGLMTPCGRWVLLTLAVAIAASRVILREHYPSDVLSGAALGTTVALGLNGANLPSAWIQDLRAWLVQPIDPASPKWSPRRSDHDWAVSSGHFFIRCRHWFPPAFIAGLFGIAVPPADL